MKNAKFNLTMIVVLAITIIFTGSCEQNEVPPEQETSLNQEASSQDAYRLTPKASVYSEGVKIIDMFEYGNVRYHGTCTSDYEIIVDVDVENINDRTKRYVNPHNQNEFIQISNLSYDEREKTFNFEYTSSYGTVKNMQMIIFDETIFEGENKKAWWWDVALTIIGVLIGNDGEQTCYLEAIATCGCGSVAWVTYESGWFSSHCRYQCE